MATHNINIDSQLVVQTAAAWASDVTVYSNKRMLITSDVFYAGTDQPRFKFGDGVQTWSNLDYVPAGGGTDTVILQYSHSSGTNLADNSDYFITGNGTLMGNTVNTNAHIPAPTGTVTRVDINTYYGGTIGTSEDSTVTLFTNNGVESNVVSTTVKFNARNSYYSITGLNWSITDGLSYIVLDTATWATNPTAAKIQINVFIEL
jgi:hypothetical protein